MRGIVAYHQKIYTERQKSNGVSPHVCATRGPDLLMANEVTFLCFRGGVVAAGGEVRGGVRVRNIGCWDRVSGSDRVCYKERPGLVRESSEVTGWSREVRCGRGGRGKERGRAPAGDGGVGHQDV